MNLIHKSLSATNFSSRPGDISRNITLFKDNRKICTQPVEGVSLSLVSVPSGSSTTSPTSLSIHRPSSLVLYPAGAVAVLYDIKCSVENKRFFCIPQNLVAEGGFITGNSPFLPNKSSSSLRDNNDTFSSQESPGSQSRLLYDKYYGSSMWDELETQNKGREKIKALSCTTISQDGKYIAVGESGKSPRILIYSITSNTTLPIAISGHTFGIKCLSFSSDSRYLVSVGFLHDATINVWSIIDKTNTIRRIASNRVTSLVRDLSWMGITIVTCGLRHVKLWKWEEEVCKTSNIGKTSLLEGKNIILGTMSDEDFMSIRSLGKESVILCSSKGEICIVFEGDRSVKRVFNVGYEISCIDINNADNLLWVAGKHSEIEAYKIYELINKNSFQEEFKKDIAKSLNILNSDSGILAIACDDHGNLVIVDGDHSIRIINTNDESKNQIIGGSSTKMMGVKSLHKNFLNAILMTWSISGTISFWDENEACILTINIAIEQPENISEETIKNELKVVQYNHHDDELITGDCYGMLRTINLRDQKELWRQMAHDGEITDIDSGVVNEKNIMISSGRDRTIQLWSRNKNTNNWNLEQTFDDHNSCINKARFHKNCQILVSCSADRTIVIRQLYEESGCTQLRYSTKKIISLRSTALDFTFISKDSTRFFVSTLDRQLLQCDIQGQIIGTYKTSEDPKETVSLENISISNVKLSFDTDSTKKTTVEKKFIAALGNDKAIRIYDLLTCSLVAKNYIHTDGATGIAWIESTQSSNKARLVSSGMDVLAIWELSIDDIQKIASTQGIYSNLKTPIRKIIPKRIIGSFSPITTKDVSCIQSKKLWRRSVSPIPSNFDLTKSDNNSHTSRRISRLSKKIVDQLEDSKRRASSPIRHCSQKQDISLLEKVSDNKDTNDSTIICNEKKETNVNETNVNETKEIQIFNDEDTLTNEINLIIDKLKEIHNDIKAIKNKDTQKRSMLFYTLQNQLISILNDLREQVSPIEIENPNKELLEKYSMQLIALIKDKIK
ncbi:hypothetical protein T552_01772 [Pneumocystis carinii B80]|uniref:Uncharacterized protein n=1 Tax=Pneumocystis carinii (strain B80) TaxID=1408658 RepID=A0A0W4ZJE0_PNEC8|nr:hypothetical protein T552_01772 [Pneumocystis carinii B80]KTW28513.1 hypothetical protein T552_01772 [Pneumocystis carinii B80]